MFNTLLGSLESKRNHKRKKKNNIKLKPIGKTATCRRSNRFALGTNNSISFVKQALGPGPSHRTGENLGFPD